MINEENINNNIIDDSSNDSTAIQLIGNNPNAIENNKVECASQLERCDMNQLQMSEQAGTTLVNINYAKNVNYYNCIFNGSHKTDEILRRYILRLQKRYNKHNMSSSLWHDNNKDLPLAKYFIPLTVDEDHMNGKFLNGQNIHLDQIFFTENYNRRMRRILITGNPGYGKSTMIRKLAYDWATLQKPNYLESFDILVVIPLIKLNNSTVQEAIFYEMGDSNEETLPIIKLVSPSFLVLLDGYDETFKKEKVLQFLETEEDDETFLDLTIVVTSRPQAAKTIWTKFDRCLSVLGFSVKNQIRYIEEVLGHENRKMENMLKKLNSNKFISELSKCPLMLHVFCCLESADSSILSTLTGLYVELIRLLIRRYCNKYKTQDISSDEQDDYFVKQNLIIQLGSLASCYFKKMKNGLPMTDISDVFLHKLFPNDDDLKFVTGLDILIPTTNSNSTCLSYDFIHRTIAEFLTAFYIAKSPKHLLTYQFGELIFHTNNFPFVCFLFGLMGAEILEYRYILNCFTDKQWKADWIQQFKSEITGETWDRLFLRSFIKKLSCDTHNFTENENWHPLCQQLEELEININPNVENWEDIRKSIEKVILKNCKWLKSLTANFQTCPQFQVTYDNTGTRLLVNMSFLMDDLILFASSYLLKNFYINLENINVDKLSAENNRSPNTDCKSQSIFGLQSRQLLASGSGLCSVWWNVGKMEFKITFRKVDSTRNIASVILLVSKEQHSIITKPPFSYPGENQNQFLVMVEGRTVCCT